MFQTGDILEQYKLLEKLGSGAYGTVFSAENLVTGQRCALKTVNLEGVAGQRELRALKAYREISHPNLLTIHHAGISGDHLYYTMDLAEGKLSDMNLDASELRRAAIEIADALAALHQAGLLHRDIKPDNLFYRNGRAVLGDIGLLTAAENASLSGTPGFLSPRILNGALPDEASDVYALAKSFYTLLSGNSPSLYPKYCGVLNEDASSLMDAIISVCEEKIGTANVFRDRLRQKRKRFTGARLFLFLGIVLMLLFINHRGRLDYLKPMIAPYPTTPLEKLQDKLAKKATLKKYPVKNGKTSVNEAISRFKFRQKYFEKLRSLKTEDRIPAYWELSRPKTRNGASSSSGSSSSSSSAGL